MEDKAFDDDESLMTDDCDDLNDDDEDQDDDASNDQGTMSSWTIQESMDQDYFFLVPPPVYSGQAGRNLNHGSFLLPASDLRLTRASSAQTTFGPVPTLASIQSQDETTDECMDSPKAVATDDINFCDPIVPKREKAHAHLYQSHPSHVDGIREVDDNVDVDEDDDDATPFKNLYQDDASLYLDEDCLTDMTEPSQYIPRKIFVTNEEASNMMTAVHCVSPKSLVSLWRHLVRSCCLPPGRSKHPAAVTPKRDDHHQRRNSEPALLAFRLNEQHILTKKTIEPRIQSVATNDRSSVPPMPEVKFRPTRKFPASHIDSNAIFVIDDASSLPDELMMAS